MSASATIAGGAGAPFRVGLLGHGTVGAAFAVLLGERAEEIERFTFRAPGQATSYFYGYQQLMATRQAAQLALAEKFDRQKFNDFVISQGLLPPGLMRTAVMDEFVPTQQGN